MNADQFAGVVKILDADSGAYKMEPFKAIDQPLNEALIPYPRSNRGYMTVDHENVALMEQGGEAATPNFPDLLRSGIMFDVFSGYNETPAVYPMVVDEVGSNKQQEEYLRDAGIGLAPVVAEGEPYPEASLALEGGVTITNHKRGYVIPVTEEMQMFDQVGKVRDIANMVGRSLRLTEDQAFFDVLTTTANYTRGSTAGDNDVGDNTQTLTFSADGLRTAFGVLTTMKDRHSGMPLGVRPDTMIVGPLLWWAVRQLLESPELMRAHGNTTAETVGTGTRNPFFNVVNTIIVSPQLGSTYEWALLERRRAIKFQRVRPVEVLIESMGVNTSQYLTRDVIRYRGRTWFGVGMKDDRFAFFSDSTTEPTVS